MDNRAAVKDAASSGETDGLNKRIQDITKQERTNREKIRSLEDALKAEKDKTTSLTKQLKDEEKTSGKLKL